MEFHALAEIFPLMEGADFDELVNDIRENGLLEPIVIYNDKIIDGRNRYRACEKLEIDPQYMNWSENGSLISFVESENLHRRHLTSSQWAVCAFKVLSYYKEEAKRRQLASLPSKGQKGFNVSQIIDKHKGRATGHAAKDYKTNRQYISDIKKINEEAPELIDEIHTGKITVPKAKKMVSKKILENKYEISEKKIDEIIMTDRYQLICDNFTEVSLQEKVKLIFTDPPYGKEYLDVWAELAKFAKNNLVENGFLIVYSGQLNLPTVFKILSTKLDYYWTFALIHKGNKQLIFPRNIFCGWKPILVFQNGFKNINYPLDDIIKGAGREKSEHPWQQAGEEIRPIIEHFTLPGDTIIDPLMGSGTIPIQCLRLKRKTIGIEFNSYYFEKTRDRINELSQQ